MFCGSFLKLPLTFYTYFIKIPIFGEKKNSIHARKFLAKLGKIFSESLFSGKGLRSAQ